MQDEIKNIADAFENKGRDVFDVSSNVRSYDALKTRKVLDIPFIDLVKESSAISKFGAEFIEDDNFKGSNWFPVFESGSDEVSWLEANGGTTNEAIWTSKGVEYKAFHVSIGYEIKRADRNKGPNGWRAKDAVQAGSAVRLGRGIANVALVGTGLKGQPSGMVGRLGDSAIKGTTSKTISREQFAGAIKAIADEGFETDHVAVITSSADQESLLQQTDEDGKAWRYNEPSSPSNQTLYGIPAAVSDKLLEGQYIIGIWSYLKVIHSPTATKRSVITAEDSEKIFSFLTCDTVPISLGAFKLVDNTGATGGA